jgi:hypothetical protein
MERTREGIKAPIHPHGVPIASVLPAGGMRDALDHPPRTFNTRLVNWKPEWKFHARMDLFQELMALIAMKVAAGRARDIADVEMLKDLDR